MYFNKLCLFSDGVFLYCPSNNELSLQQVVCFSVDAFQQHILLGRYWYYSYFVYILYTQTKKSQYKNKKTN